MPNSTQSAFDVMKRQHAKAAEVCTICGGDSPVCSNGIHWLRAIRDGKLNCVHPGCKNVAAIGREGRAYCGQH